MDRSLPMLLIGLLFGGGLGFTLAAANGVTLDGHDHADAAGHAHGAAQAAPRPGHAEAAPHDHAATLSLPPDQAPRLAVEATRDAAAGWNLHLETENFRFAPENASAAHVPGEGHAHVYVNGTKIGRYYAPWLHLGDLPEGKVTVKVTLNANDHRALAADGEPVAETLTLEN